METFYAVFLDLEDERPDAYFCSAIDAQKYLDAVPGPCYGDVLEMKMSWEQWNNVFYTAKGDENES